MYLRLRSIGFSVKDAFNIARVKRRTAYKYDDNWRDEKYEGLIPKPGAGRKTLLNEDQMKELGKILETKKKWLVNDVIKIIKDKFSIEFSYDGCKNLLIKQFDVKLDKYHKSMKKKKKSLKSIFKKEKNTDPESLDEIIKLISEEKDVFILKKLFYILFRSIGISSTSSSRFISVTTKTGNNWINSWKSEKYEGLLRKPGQGRKSKLTDEE
ncbi:MAG: hypothetical protein LBT66_05385 [Methanobrevibacter sp.]|jgi:transposase|nr:hypothetical protein [Candidatus Methanovirga meridionalis]